MCVSVCMYVIYVSINLCLYYVSVGKCIYERIHVCMYVYVIVCD